MDLSNEMERVLIVSFTPYFVEKGYFWFEENLNKVLSARKTQSFWQDSTLFLEKGDVVKLSEILKKLDEMGYEKVFKVTEPGEFSHLGGVVDIFPVNLAFALRLDFLGNRIETIEKTGLKIKNEELTMNFLKKKLKSQKMFADLRGIKPDNYLVHLDHGIGQFKGIGNFQSCLSADRFPILPVGRQVLNFQTNSKEQNQKLKEKKYYILEYSQGDKLYVPLGLERKLSKYIGFTEPKLSRLGSSLWQKTKRKIKEEAEKLAKELLQMFAEKELAQRPAYHNKEFAENLEASFKYALTPDQAQTLADIENDFLKKELMDRIVCGDVGFGKTEVALRAAIRAAENNKQAALICPTTILAAQHYETFQKRISDPPDGGQGLPFSVAMLSRLQPVSERKKIIQGLKQGQIDIVIGTHSLLAKSVVFQKLGLLIIDDEQKFGVKQKEKLRSKNPCLDVLYLSATPIPRTLYLALSSLKKISLIQTPPEGRKAIKTFVLPFGKKVIKKAIAQELKRKGQIYFLHNRVETILGFKQFLESLNTGAKIGILHAKLPEKEIIGVLTDFQKGRFNLLLATTIIENGLDIANVNTLIVSDATRLGLSQAYQLRGRVGRSKTQSFSWFLYPPKQLKGLAKKRLRALKEAGALGSGYQIALADLEIRGAGNVLGKEQSGNVNRVGLNLYCQMLSEAVERIKQVGE